MTIRELLIKHEGFRLFPYLCTAGKTTIGIGRNLTDNGISKAEAMHLLENDIEQARQDIISILPGFYALSENRRMAFIDMIFNIGKTSFLGFKRMIQAVKDQDWDRAADAMMDSLWATQVPNRAKEISDLVRSG